MEDMKRLEVFDNDCLRRIEKCNRRDRVPFKVLRQRLQLPTVPDPVLQRAVFVDLFTLPAEHLTNSCED